MSEKGQDEKSAPAAGEDKDLQDYLAKKRDASRSGGVYVPPFRLKQQQQEVQDTKSRIFQRTQWDALRKSINGLINKVFL